MKTTHQWLKEAEEKLVNSRIETARLDALVLLSDTMGKDRSYLLAHPELELTKEQRESLQKLLSRRAKHEPLAYIRGKTEFYGREFTVNKYVLEPRPESETMIELLKKEFVHQSFARVIDVGTGSGALAITAKLELPKLDVLVVDIDPRCLEVAQKNAKSHGTSIEFLQGNLLEPIFNRNLVGPLAVLANLPYVPDGYQINRAAGHEPSLALFGGPDGLDMYRTMFSQLSTIDYQQLTYVFTEALPSQHHELANIARAQNYVQIAKEGFVQVYSNR